MVEIFKSDFFTASLASFPASIFSLENLLLSLFSINLLFLLPKLFVTITSAPALIKSK